MNSGKIASYFKLLRFVCGLGFLIILARFLIVDKKLTELGNLKFYKNIQQNDSLNVAEIVLDITRLTINLELNNYNSTYSNVENFKDLIMESGGTPLRSVIVSSWRSGSTFLGELLNAISGTFYTYEPLMMFKSRQIRNSSKTISIYAAEIVKNMLKCDFPERYFKFVKMISKTVNQIEYNRRLWSLCRYESRLCYDVDFTKAFCKLCPFHTMKLVRLRLSVFNNILDDEELNTKVVLLVRDPRGVMASRRQIKHFCGNPKAVNYEDCADAKHLCDDMVNDYKAAESLLQKYPNRLMVLRFEDLLANLNGTTVQLLNFLRLYPVQSIYEYLKTHTSQMHVGHFSTYRVSQNVPFKLTKTTNFSDVQEIQEVCRKAMEMWGYQLADNATHLTREDFNPLLPYKYSNYIFS